VSARDNVLERIRAARGKSGASRAEDRAAVTSYIEAHQAGPRPAADWEPIVRFRESVLALASTFEEVGALAAVPRAVAEYLRSHDLPLTAVCWPDVSELPWGEAGIRVEARAARGEDLVGITGVFCAVAETGTLMLLSGARTPAATSLLPETHIALVRAGQLVRSMEDGWERVRSECGKLPRAVNFVSGPSRTADIEQTLTLGAHGPYRVHVLLVP
jgi:L-lactate dehydrogenase complex protein LldG